MEFENLNVQYYSSWHWSLVHVLTSIPGYQSVKAISERLALPAAEVETILVKLQRWGSVRGEKGRWKFAGNEHHISKSNPLVTFHHSNWRQKAVLNSQRQNPESVHFSVVQSVSQKDYNQVRELILETIGRAAKIAGPSTPEKVCVFNCDFFEP